MQIIWHGQFCFQITTQKIVNIIIDPFDNKVSKLEPDILLKTHNNIKIIKNNSFIINSPGEYEIKEVYIQGISSFIDNPEKKEENIETVIYIIEVEEIRICHLGSFGQKELNEEQVEKIGDIDILIIPVKENAKKIISQIEPKIIIPMYSQKENLAQFIKSMGIKSPEPLSKLSLKKKDILEETKIIVLKH